MFALAILCRATADTQTVHSDLKLFSWCGTTLGTPSRCTTGSTPGLFQAEKWIPGGGEGDELDGWLASWSTSGQTNRDLGAVSVRGQRPSVLAACGGNPSYQMVIRSEFAIIWFWLGRSGPVRKSLGSLLSLGWSLHVLLVSAWILCRFSGLLHSSREVI